MVRPDSPLIPDRLDELIPMAEKFGVWELKQVYDYQHLKFSYEASISSRTEGGSSIWARGRGETAVEALQAALKEARALYAGYLLAKA